MSAILNESTNKEMSDFLISRSMRLLEGVKDKGQHLDEEDRLNYFHKVGECLILAATYQERPEEQMRDAINYLMELKVL